MDLETFRLDASCVILVDGAGERVLSRLSLRVRTRINSSKWPKIEETPRFGMRLALLGLIDTATDPAGDLLSVRMAEAFCVPDEAILYWFTGCFYGQRQESFRKAWCALLS